MILTSVTVQRFRNFVEKTTFDVEDGVTALVGKNEAGKSTVLHALYRLNPANAGYPKRFDLTNEYPRWRLARDRRDNNLERISPISAKFRLDDSDLTSLSSAFGVDLPHGTECEAGRNYKNGLWVKLRVPLDAAIDLVGNALGCESDDIDNLKLADSVEAASDQAKTSSGKLAEDGHTARAAALKKLPAKLKAYEPFFTGSLDEEQRSAVASRLPKFFYFSDYATLPGKIDLHDVLKKGEDDLTEAEQTARSLLRFAGVEGQEFLDDDFESRKSELEAAAIELSGQVFKYWKQNPDLSVEFDDDYIEVGKDQQNQPIYHRNLDVRLRDHRHGGVTTNFSTRSAGFQWFFSFLAAFSEFENSDDRLVVLLDEPGTSLHGEAQRDFLTFIFERLGAQQQVIYTTHSQHMIDPARYETLRAVEDLATRDNPDLGASVGPVRLSTDRDTVLPVQAALGYSISQHLFLGGYHHVVVEGGADFIYLTEFSDHLKGKSRTSLNPSLSILPVGGADKIPAFVALLGKYLRVSVLMDGGKNSSHFQRLKSLIKEGVIPEARVLLCSAIPDTHSSADIEDLFAESDYLRLFNWAFGTNLGVSDLPSETARLLSRIEQAYGSTFDHGLPAQQIARHRDEFFASADEATLARFEHAISLLNATAADSDDERAN